MNILNTLKNKELVIIPYWITVLTILEWAWNTKLKHDSFGIAMFLLVWSYQNSTEQTLNRWFLYSLRTIVLSAALIIAHKQLVFDTLTKLGF